MIEIIKGAEGVEAHIALVERGIGCWSIMVTLHDVEAGETLPSAKIFPVGAVEAARTFARECVS